MPVPLPPVIERPPIPVVVQQHAEESAILRQIRSVLVRAPHVRLRHLRRLDERIAAHLDGLAVAGAFGTALCTAALARVGPGEAFAVTVRAIEERDDKALDRAIALGAALPVARRGLLSAFGWVPAAQLQGIVRRLLAADDAMRRELGLAACRLHGVDPGLPLESALDDGAPALRAAALRIAGELGRTALLPRVLAAMAHEDAEVHRRAVVAACLLGDRGDALHALEAMCLEPGAAWPEGEALLMQASDFERGRALLQRIAQSAPRSRALERRVMRAGAMLGDTSLVPWLIERMADDAACRLAGESFSLITGADLAALDLERKPPAGVQAGPSDDPAADDVALDEDDSLPWADREPVERWWRAHEADMPRDARCFMGGAPGGERCTQVLREGFQRQRLAAARHACLLAPGTPLFPACAPAWRQQRRLFAQ
jgi:uncharacterized protein (TIGR02270 family)